MARDGFDCSELFDFSEKLLAQPKELEKAQKSCSVIRAASCAARQPSKRVQRSTAQQ